MKKVFLFAVLAIVAVAVIGLTASITSAAVIAVNSGSFENPGPGAGANWGTLDPAWSGSNGPYYLYAEYNNDGPQDLIWEVALENVTPISQDLLTSVNAGDQLSVQFWMRGAGGGGTASATFLVGATSYSSSTVTGGGGPDTWVQQTFTQTVANAGNLVLQFQTLSGNMELDNVSNVTWTPPPTGDLRINKWNDLDGDGEWVADNDPLLGGWTFNVSGVSPTLTDNGPLDEDPLDGTILVTGLDPGQYTIMENLAGHDGWNWTHGLLVATVNAGEEAVADWANHYTPPSGVPEPAGLGLIGAALLFLKRRRS